MLKTKLGIISRPQLPGVKPMILLVTYFSGQSFGNSKYMQSSVQTCVHTIDQHFVISNSSSNWKLSYIIIYMVLLSFKELRSETKVNRN